MLKILERFQQTTKENCKTKKAYELYLPGDAGYGTNWQFEGQGRTALRLAHFLSNFLQNVEEYEVGRRRESTGVEYFISVHIDIE